MLSLKNFCFQYAPTISCLLKNQLSYENAAAHSCTVTLLIVVCPGRIFFKTHGQLCPIPLQHLKIPSEQVHTPFCLNDAILYSIIQIKSLQHLPKPCFMRSKVLFLDFLGQTPLMGKHRTLNRITNAMHCHSTCRIAHDLRIFARNLVCNNKNISNTHALILYQLSVKIYFSIVM